VPFAARYWPVRTALTAVAAGTVLVAGWAPAASATAAPPLSQGRPATASSEDGPARVAGKAVDGDTGTAWRSRSGSPQWIAVDLGAAATVTAVTLRWTRACARDYRVQTSADGVAWNTDHTTTGGTGGVENIALTGLGRFVRVYATRPCHHFDGYGLAEFEVYGSPGVVDTEPPSAPTGLRVTAVNPTSVSFIWTLSTDNLSVAAYDIYSSGALLKTVDGTTFPVTVSKLTPAATYAFYVNARDGAGNVSQASSTVTVTTPPLVVDKQPPTPPTGVHATATTADSVTLAWTAATDEVGVTGYTVHNGSDTAVTAIGTTATVYGLAPATAYAFTVTAADAAGNVSAPSDPVPVTTLHGRDPVGEVSQITTDTDVPWGLDFLPDGSALMAERDTHNVVRVTVDGQKTVAGTIPDVSGTDGEGGLLGLAVSPRFRADHWVYLFHTTATDNRIVRLRYANGSLDLGSEQVLLSGIARNKFHNAGRLRFGPDGKLYAGTGDAQNGANAQNLNSLNGKILRLNPDGSVPRDNPFPGRYVWSYGHRNIEGLAFDSRGRLWEAELGNSLMDELNLIEPGHNYGWPACEGTAGDCADPTFVPPVQTWPVAAASPSGLAVVDDTLYMAALRGTQLWRMTIKGRTTTVPQAYFTGTFGRLRTVEAAPDGGLWLTTSNGGDKDSVPNNSNNRILHLALGCPG
jgi:glucose/arabinose dehydrogenase